MKLFAQSFFFLFFVSIFPFRWNPCRAQTQCDCCKRHVTQMELIYYYYYCICNDWFIEVACVKTNEKRSGKKNAGKMYAFESKNSKEFINDFYLDRVRSSCLNSANPLSKRAKFQTAAWKAFSLRQSDSYIDIPATIDL